MAELKKVSIIVSQGSLEGVYPGLIMANGARMEGIEANLFFTFFGLNALHKKKWKKIRVSSLNPGLPIPKVLGIIPGMSSLITWQMRRTMEKLDFPPIDEFLELIHDSGGKIYACKAAADMFGYKKEDFFPFVEGPITVGEFYEVSQGGEIIFT